MAKQITESFPEERDDIILDVLKRQGKIRVTEVCDILSIAPSTARLLLQSMQEKGLLQRTHGGAIPVDIPEQTKPNRDFSEIENYEAKLKVATRAAATIQDGDYIAIGSGTTTYLLATLLHNRQDLTIVTDSFPVANELLHEEGITLYIAGGWIMKRNSSCRGLSAERFFKELTDGQILLQCMIPLMQKSEPLLLILTPEQKPVSLNVVLTAMFPGSIPANLTYVLL